MRYDHEVEQLADRFQLGLPAVPSAGRSGELLGRGTGSSLEFQEYREYMPGDDIRHLDWAAYARSDALMIRLYREEISPRTEILFDVSKSMTSGGTLKPHVVRQLSALFAVLSGRLGGRPVIVLLNDQEPLRTIDSGSLEFLSHVQFDGVRNPYEMIIENRVPLKRQAVRIFISDFLFPHDPGALVRRLATDASALWMIQVLNRWESDPTPLGGRKLVDLETEGELDLLLDRRTIAGYVERLGMLQTELARNCRRAKATFVTLVADRGLPTLCRDDLCAVGILRPA